MKSFKRAVWLEITFALCKVQQLTFSTQHLLQAEGGQSEKCQDTAFLLLELSSCNIIY